MSFEVYRFSHIPCMAWCVEMNPHTDDVRLYAGTKVEVAGDAFVEGAWDGSFDEMSFDTAEFLCGSGGKLEKNGGVLLATSCHVLDRTVVLKTEAALSASNSVPFLLMKSGSQLDPDYSLYERDFCSIKDGLKHYRAEIRLAGNRTFHIYYYCNIRIDRQLHISVLPKRIANNIRNYGQYHDEMLSMLMRFRKNAQAERRRKTFGLVTTVSKGYDSAACAAMAYKIGCMTAVTFNEPEKYAGDNGDVVARQLGYTDIRYGNADHCFANKGKVEAFHTATGELGTTIVFEAFEKDFKDNIVFYGERGDQFWDKNAVRPNGEFRFADQLVPGIGMAEWRLQVGFILLPIAFYKAAYWPELYSISRSDEMWPWSIGGAYDRPIPRRICEDMGVKREEFGQSKKGAGFNFNRDNLTRIKARMSPDSYESFYTYYRTHKRKGNFLAQARYICKMLPDYANYAFGKAHIPIKFRKKEWNLTNPGAPSYLINWGLEECIKKYRI